MDVYSTTLLISMLVAAVAVLGAVAAWLRRDDVRFARTAQVAGVLSVLLAVVALSYHFVRGHRPGTVMALSVAHFLGEHPAPLVTILAGAMGGWLAAARSSRQSQDA